MNVLMPQLGETVAEGTVAAWHKKQGDAVEKNEVLLDVETDKAAIEVPAPVAGVISSVLVPEGKTVDVGTVLAVIEAEGSADAPAATDKPAGEEAAEAKSGSPGKPSSGKRSGRRAAKTRGRGGKSERLRLSPVVRRLLAEHEIDAKQISGSGRDGRITRKDVLAFVEQRTAADSSAVEPASKPASPKSPVQPTDDVAGEATRVPFDRIRPRDSETHGALEGHQCPRHAGG